jgi:hypothetical protein
LLVFRPVLGWLLSYGCLSDRFLGPGVAGIVVLLSARGVRVEILHDRGGAERADELFVGFVSLAAVAGRGMLRGDKAGSGLVLWAAGVDVDGSGRFYA